MSRRMARMGVALFASMVAFVAFADTRATLSKDAVAVGETVMLTIDTDQPIASPQLAPLRRDFGIGNIDSSRQIGFDGQGVRASQQIRIALKPLRSGMLSIPALAIGNQKTAPMLLEVVATGATPSAPARSSSASMQAGGPVFIDTVIDDETPYVQQAVGVTVRLHYALNLFNGEFRQPEPPAGASLQPMGSDSRSVRVVDGRQYQVLERHYLLLPERSGVLRLPGASFSGEGESGFFDGLFGDGRERVSADAPARQLRVQAIPLNAPRLWLPARQVSLRIASPPTEARAGEAFDLVVELRADGATAAQLPELQMQGPGAQVFAEPAQSTENFANGRPQVTTTRRFSIVPQQPGTLRLQVVPVAWWDVAADGARRAETASITMKVLPGLGRYAAATQEAAGAAQTDDAASISADGMARLLRLLRWWPAGIALLLAIGLAWWASRRRLAADVLAANDAARRDVANAQASSATSTSNPSGQRADFHRALKAGDLPTLARLLPALAKPPAASLAEARKRLSDPAQSDAAAQLERALWGGSDAEAARIAMRHTFAQGPCWQPPAAKEKPLLPPLYPER